MATHHSHNEFAPRQPPGFLRALALAILAHGVLVAVLTIGVQWKRTLPPVTAEAELWASIPQAAAPAEPVEELPQPEPAKPAEKPAPPPVVQPPPAPPVKQVADADIALAKEKARKEKEQERQQKLALEKQEQDKRAKELEAREKLQKEKADKAAKDKKLEEQRAKDAALAKDKEAKAKAEAKARDQEHQKTVQRMLQLANAGTTSTDPNGSGSAAKSAGPSASYAGRIKAILRRNTTFTETLAGNPSAEAEVRTLSDGTILSAKIIKSSGVKSWDDAVINAINKTETLPRDVDGRVPPVLIIIHTPKD